MEGNDTDRSMGGHECIDCGEFITADSTLPEECPNCGAVSWAKVSPS